MCLKAVFETSIIVLNSSLSFKYLNYNFFFVLKKGPDTEGTDLDRTFLSLQCSVSYPNVDTI